MLNPISPITLTVAELASPVEVPLERDGSLLAISMANVTGITGGTLTMRFAQHGSTIFETPSGGNTIDLANPESLTVIDGVIGTVEFSLSGFTGTATELAISVINYAY